MSEIENELEFHLKAFGIKGWVREYRFLIERKWRFDFAFPEIKLAVEVDGGQWIKGGHNTGTGKQRDCDKDEAALLDGWIVYRVTPSMVKSGRAVQTIDKLIKIRS
jgi:very-short-patch-repair endonuclease